jgi:transposase-like protein
MRTTHRFRRSIPARPTFAGFRFPPDVIVLAVRWYLRFGLSYRDVEELLAERGIQADHVTIYRWMLRFTPLLADAARPCRHRLGDRWQVDETYVKVAGQWRYVYRAIDQFGQVIDVFVSPRRNIKAAQRFFEQAIGTTKIAPAEVTTDQAPVYPAVLEDLLPAALHRTDRVRQQSGRVRPWEAEGAAASDAWAQTGPQRHSDHRRTRLRAEPSPRTLRAGGGGARQPASGGRIRRTGLGDLIPGGWPSACPGRRNATAPVACTRNKLRP